MICLGLLGCVVFGISLSGSRSVASWYRARASFPAEGFDFSLSMKQKWSGPEIGEHLDLTHFVGRDGVHLTDSIKGRMFILINAAPDCRACQAAHDQMQNVCDRLARANVECKLAAVFTLQSPAEVFKAMDAWGVQSPAFLWQRDETFPPEKILKMVMPSFILLDRQGTILRKWPGTDRRQLIRFRMANQIVADTLQELSQRAH